MHGDTDSAAAKLIRGDDIGTYLWRRSICNFIKPAECLQYSGNMELEITHFYENTAGEWVQGVVMPGDERGMVSFEAFQPQSAADTKYSS